MRNILITILFSLGITLGYSQFTMTNLGNHTYQVNSAYPDSDMHFYLFGDGYHSFESDPTHQFISGSSVVAFHSGPYDDDDPQEESVGSSSGGTGGSTNDPPAEMNSMVKLKRSWNLSQFNHNFFVLMVENNTNQITSGCVEFHYNINDSAINSGDILDDFGNSWFTYLGPNSSPYQADGFTDMFSWSFQNMIPGEQRFIYIPAECLPVGYSNVKTAAIIKTNNCSAFVEMPTGSGSGGSTYTDEAYLLESIVQSHPHDPNVIIPHCNWFGPNYDERTITYTVYFKNEGTGPARDVFIDYYTDYKVNSIELIATSDYVELNRKTKRRSQSSFVEKARFTFPDIYLPGSNQQNPSLTPDQSPIGWVTFDVCYLLDYIDDEIDNRIEIKFDSQAPIIAREKVYRNDIVYPSIYCEENSCPENIPHHQTLYPDPESNIQRSIAIDEGEELFFNISPNPAYDELVLELESFKSQLYKGQIIDITGQLVKNVDIDKPTNRIDVSDFQSGIYYLRIIGSTETKIKSFVKN